MDDKLIKKQINLAPEAPTDYNFERMLKTFIKQVDKSGILQEVKARRYHIKKSELIRLEKKEKRRK